MMAMDGSEANPEVLAGKEPANVTTHGHGKRLVPVFANILADVGVSLTVRLGSGAMSVKDLLALREGAVVTLDMPLNGVVDVCLNEAVIARGEIVAVGDHYGVRITEVADLEL